MKQVLIASFYFPPYAGISWVRAFKFCKFLPEYGWTPWVLTVDKRYYGSKTTNSSPNLEFIRQSSLPYIPVPSAKTFASLLYPLYILFFVLKNRSQIDAVLMIGSPYHPFLLTPIFRRLLRLPTLLDFRDAWSYNFGFDGKKANDTSLLSKLKNNFFFKIEQISLRHALAATFATSTLRDEYARLIPEYQEKYHAIFNGYDEDDFRDITPVSVTKNKTIVLAGKFYIYTPAAVSYFLEILRDIQELTFLYIGEENKTIESIARKLNVKDQVISMGYHPYDRVLQLIAGSDYCLLANGLVNGMGTKIFDYLALGKPTLCLVPQGSIITSQFSQISGIVISEAPHSKERIMQGLLELFNYSTIKGQANQFTRKKAAEKLAILLDNSLP